MQNETDFSKYLNKMEKRFLLREGVDHRGMHEQQRELIRIREKLADERSAFEKVTTGVELLKQEYKEKQKDLVKMENYCADLKIRKDLRTKETEALKQVVDTKKDKETSLKEHISQLRNIALIKKDDLNSYNIDSAMKIIIGTANSMGIEIK